MSDQPTKEISTKDAENQVIEVLKTIFDPEIPVNIYDMGLIYEVNVNDQFEVDIIMTLTTPSCPVAESLPPEVEQKVESLWSIKSAKVNIVWEPPWDKDMMSEEAKLELGFL
jgi:FeS assembly SUF system protein